MTNDQFPNDQCGSDWFRLGYWDLVIGYYLSVFSENRNFSTEKLVRS
jgi:hypothetical protein